MIVPALGIGNLDSFLETLINMTAATSLLPVLFLLIAYIMLRWKKDDMPRDFRFGNRTVGLTAGIFPALRLSVRLPCRPCQIRI